MAQQYVYLGESHGGRILRLAGTELTQLTAGGSEAVLPALEPWPHVPVGPAGDSVFRMIVATIRYTNGYAIRITPIVDGVEQLPQDFTGSGSGIKDCQAPVQVRGARVTATVEAIARTGDLEFLDVQVAYFPMRAIP